MADTFSYETIQINGRFELTGLSLRLIKVNGIVSLALLQANRSNPLIVRSLHTVAMS